MRPPSRTFPYSTTASTAKSTLLIATLLARACTATLPAPPSPADQWLYPDINTIPTYNYLDTVNASWTSDFIAPYLLLRCQVPNNAAKYAYPYNRSVSATGSALVPLDDGNAWVCHFEVTDLQSSNATPPTFISNDFNIVVNDGQKPVLWTTNSQQDGGESAAASASSTPTTTSPSTTGISASSTPTSSITKPHDPLTSPTSTPLTTAPTTSQPSSTASPTPSPTSPTPSTTTTGLSKSQKTAIIVGATMGALLLLVIAVAVLFVLRTRRSERNAVVYRRGDGDRYGVREVGGLEAPRERWKGVEVVPSGPMQGYF